MLLSSASSGWRGGTLFGLKRHDVKPKLSEKQIPKYKSLVLLTEVMFSSLEGRPPILPFDPTHRSATAGARLHAKTALWLKDTTRMSMTVAVRGDELCACTRKVLGRCRGPHSLQVCEKCEVNTKRNDVVAT